MHILITIPLSAESVQGGNTSFFDGVPETADLFDVKRLAVVDSAFLVSFRFSLYVNSEFNWLTFEGSSTKQMEFS